VTQYKQNSVIRNRTKAIFASGSSFYALPFGLAIMFRSITEQSAKKIFMHR